MINDIEDLIALIFFTIMLFAIAAVCSFAYNSTMCHARWSDSNINAEYHVFGGCKVENSKGQLIPEKSYRNVD